jgi:Tol biopolymer transport system component
MFVTRGAKNSDIDLAPAIGGGPVTRIHECPRTFEKCNVFFPRWSHDGTRIAFWAFRGVDDSGLYIMPAEGGVPEFQRVQGGLDVAPMAWSPTDSEIAYIEDGDNNITAKSATSNTTRSLVSCQCRFHDALDWADVNPIITIKDASRPEGDSGTGNMRFKVQLSGRADSAVSVDLTTESRAGGAAQGEDFDAVQGTVTIQPGQTEEYFNVPVRGDTALEANERFHVLLSNPQNGELGRRKAYGKIVDDDKPPPPSPSPSPSVSPSPSPSTSPPPTGPGAIAYQAGAGEVWLIDPDGTDKHKLTDGITPDWKPDGSMIAFSSANDIFQIPAAGGTPTKINGTANFDGSPSWAPGGNGISWTSLTGGAPDVFKAEPPTGAPAPVAATAALEYNQDWDVLHDGTEVMAMTKDGAIVFVNPDTGAQIGSPLVPASENADNPAISPDGSKLAYNSNLHGDPDIFVLNLTSPGTPAAHLTTSAAEDVAPTWSPDGTMLAFASNRTGNFEIFTMDAATGAGQTNITNASGDDVEPAWGPAGTSALSSEASGSLEQTITPTPTPQPSPSGSTTAAMIGVPTLLLGSVLWTRRRR